MIQERPRPLAQTESTVHPYMVVALLMLGNFLGPLYSSTANVIIPNLVAAFGSDVDTMQWAVTGYMLGYSISMPLAGWLADTFGRRRVYIVGLAVFTVASVLVSFAFDATSLIGFRILQAVGGGLISPTSMALITDVVPSEQRGQAIGIWGMGMMLAPAFGPWISGAIVDSFDDWRLVYWLGVPIGIAAFVLCSLYLPADRKRTTGPGRFDLPGFATLAVALAAFLIPLSQGNRVGWDDPAIVESFIASAVFFAAFIAIELRTQSPMLDLSLFRERTFAAAAFLRLILGVSYYFALFLLPVFTQDVLGWTPTQSGAVLVPAGILTAVLMPVSGFLIGRVGARTLIMAGMAMAAVGTFMFSHIDLTWDPNRIALYNIVRAGSMGIFYTPLTTIALLFVPRTRIGAASGILNTVWQVGGSLGIGVAQAYLTNRVAIRQSTLAASAVLSRPPVRDALAQWSRIAAMHHLPPSTAMAMLSRLYEQAATVQAYGDTFLAGAIAIAISLPATLLLARR